MICAYSYQYNKPCVYPCDEKNADEIIKYCKEHGATYDEGDGIILFVVVLRPEVGPELWTERALRGSL